MKQISEFFRGRISILDLLNTPADIVHELFKHSLIKANADAEAEEQRKKQEEEEELARRHGKKIKKPNNAPPPMPNIQMDELEELFEEEM